MLGVLATGVQTFLVWRMGFGATTCKIKYKIIFKWFTSDYYSIVPLYSAIVWLQAVSGPLPGSTRLYAHPR